MNPMKMTEGQKTEPKARSFAEKVRSLRSFRAFTQTSVMRKKNIFPYRERVGPNHLKSPQTPQATHPATNCN